VIDTAAQRLLVAVRNDANGGKPSVFRCRLDGTSCVHLDVSAGQGPKSGYTPRILIDGAGNKLLVVTTNDANGQRPSLFRCNLDATSCSHADLSAGQGPLSGTEPSAVIDEGSGKLLVATSNGANGNHLSLFRCGVDGTGCAHTDLSTGLSDFSFGPVALIDPATQKLVVVSADFSHKPSLHRCNLDGTGCTLADLSAGQPAQSCYGSPAAVLDPNAQKLLVACRNAANSDRPSLFRCNTDGTGCAHVDLSEGKGNLLGFTPNILLDAASQRILVVTASSGGLPQLFRCAVDGTGCTSPDISGGQSVQTGFDPSAVLDTAHHRLLVATDNLVKEHRLGLFLFSP
jgi:hypothetical protein